MSVVLSLRDVHKRYVMGENVVHALRGVSLEIQAGDFVAIMGPSGSGKSTLMHVLGLLDVPGEGSYQICGREAANLSEDDLAVLRRRTIGFIFQQFNLLPRLSAVENVGLPLLYTEHAPDWSRVDALLERVGLGARKSHRPNEMSGGQQQRVAIARALVNEPVILLADEPTGNLDSVSEREIMQVLTGLNDSGITVVVVTHEESIGRQARRLIRMRDGVVHSDERLDELPRPAPPPELPRDEKRPFSVVLEHFAKHTLQGVRNLSMNKVRTALSMLGILIGVGAVVAMIAVGRGAQESIKDSLSSLGSNLL
nr:ATP-binding cassette domain-containing protein [Bdellovibrionales bacterium]